MVRDMKITRISCILMMTLLVATDADITAASDIVVSDFRCGSRIITTGDYKHDVLRKCGEPSHVEVWQEVRIIRDFGFGLIETEMELHRWPPFGEEHVMVEGWEYNLGPSSFTRYLRFENDRLIRITLGDYGY